MVTLLIALSAQQIIRLARVSALKCVNIFLEKIVTFRLNHVIAVYGEPFTTKVVTVCGNPYFCVPVSSFVNNSYDEQNHVL